MVPVLAFACLAMAAMSILVLRVRPLRPMQALGPLQARLAVDGVVCMHSVAVVIPARNEERSLPLLLADIRAQTSVPGQILVVDDESDDRTDKLARSGGASVVRVPARPAGWNPKVWALTVGSDYAVAETLVFLDADVRLDPPALAVLVADVTRVGGLVSVAPQHRTTTAREGLSAICNVIAVAGGGPGLHRQSRGAVGSCIAISRKDYDCIGGHAGTPGTIVDDLDLAAAATRHGLPVTLRRGAMLVTMRSYPDGLAALVDGWSKNIAAGAARTRPVVALAVGAWIATLVLPIPLLLAHHSGAAAVLWAVVSLHTAWLTRSVGRFNLFVVSVAAPVVAVFTTALTLRSFALAVSGRTVVWKGRRLRPDGVERPVVEQSRPATAPQRRSA